MDGAVVWVWLFIVIFLLSSDKRRGRAMLSHKINSEGDKNKMLEPRKELIGRNVYIYMMDGNSARGVIKGVTEGGAIILDVKRSVNYISSSYVVRIVEMKK